MHGMGLCIQKWKLIVFVGSLSVIVLCIFLTIKRNDSEETTLCSKELETLKFVQVIFRHGQRTVLKNYDIVTDPYRNFTYPPYGEGALTNRGKQQMYTVGKELRKRYTTFLGDYYMQNLIKSTSSDSSRTQVSLQLVLAGLFPPNDEQKWENDLNWQPIPYRIIPKGHDEIFNGYFCPNYKKLYWEFLYSPEILQQYQNQTVYDYISLHTGLNLTTPAQLHIIYDILRAQDEFGLVLPEWTETVYPEELKNWSSMAFKYFLGTDQLKRLFIGYFLKQLLQEIHDKINNKFEEKLSLYAAHDINLFGIGLTLRLFEDAAIPYGAAIVIELHQINNIYSLRFYYVQFDQSASIIKEQLRPKLLIKVDEYSKLIQKYLPETEECGAGPDGFPHVYDF